MGGIVIAWTILVLSLFINLRVSAEICPAPCEAPQNCSRKFYVGTKKIDFYSNYPLTTKNNCIKEVIFAVHGIERNAEARYDSMLDAAKSMGKEKNVLIISPFFKNEDDAASSSDFYWHSWKQGDKSLNSGTRISSFEIADLVLENVITKGYFPQLTTAFVTGHSAGGQYTQSYAVTTDITQEFPQINFSFLVLNPSSYTYLNNLRPTPNTSNSYETPVYWTVLGWRMKPAFARVAGDCPDDYNDYKYGLEGKNTYADRYPNTLLTSQYISRRVYYFLGENDTDPNDSDLDTSCEAEVQGPYRLARGQSYFGYLKTIFPANKHSITTVPGVGHDSRRMYDASVVKNVLFGSIQ